MQKVGVLGDLHSNLSSLNAVLALLDLEGVDRLYCVGDLVGYGPRPNEVLEIIRKRGVKCVAGNHDWALLGKVPPKHFNPYARAALEWTKKRITRENLDFIDSLPLQIKEPELTIFHGALPNPEKFHYLQSFPAARSSFAEFDQKIGFCGHTHVPMSFIQTEASDELDWHFSPDWKLKSNQRAVVNVGSPGQPRDENPMAPVTIYTPSSGRIQLLRTPYNIAKEKKLIQSAKLPKILGERLEHGI